MTLTEQVEESCLNVFVTYLGRIYVEAQQIVTMSNGSIDSLGGTSNLVLKRKKAPHLVVIFCINTLFPQVNIDFFPR